jgi:hypothetical protein
MLTLPEAPDLRCPALHTIARRRNPVARQLNPPGRPRAPMVERRGAPADCAQPHRRFPGRRPCLFPVGSCHRRSHHDAQRIGCNPLVISMLTARTP